MWMTRRCDGKSSSKRTRRHGVVISAMRTVYVPYPLTAHRSVSARHQHRIHVHVHVCAPQWYVSSSGMCTAVVCVQQWYVHSSGMCPAVVCAQQWYVSSSGDMMPPTNDAAELVIAQHRTSNWLRVAPYQ
eukprot:scpid20357/ scgid32458/ 